MISVKSLDASNYPTKLHRLGKIAPEHLYFSGDVSILSRPCVAVIGSRSMTEYAEFLLNTYVKDFFSYDVTVISGFVRGVDISTHKIGLARSCGSVGVLGSGIDYVLNKGSLVKLAQDNIACGGLFLSEYRDNFCGRKWSYAQRNRLVAALSDAVLVIEAAEKSGTIITASWAFSLSVPIFILSFPLDCINAKGLVRIHKEFSATIITDLMPVFEVLGIKHTTQSPQEATLEDDTLLSIIRHRPLNFDELIGVADNFEIGQLTTALMELLIEGKICLVGDRYYAK